MSATHFYLITPHAANFFKYGITSDPYRRLNEHLNTVGAALVHVAPLDDPRAFENSVGKLTAHTRTRRGTSETADISARAAVLELLREKRATILEFHAVVGECAMPDVIPGMRGVTRRFAEDDIDPTMTMEDLKLLVKRGGPDDFLRCKDLHAATKNTGMEVSAAKLGRLMASTFGIKSEMRHMAETNSKARGFVGLAWVGNEVQSPTYALGCNTVDVL